jgi:AraC family transcriptional regulator
MEGLKKTTYQDYSERMLKVLVFIQQHLDEDVLLEELAEVACFSPYHFHRIFRGMVGESVKGYVRRLRLERAAQRLKNSVRSVTDIAFEAGYEAHESFTRAFGDMFGHSPRAYRNSHQRPKDTSPALNAQAKDTLEHLMGRESRSTNMKVEIVEMKPVQLAYVRHVGPYNQCARAWETLCTWAGPRGLLAPGCQFMGLCYDDPDVTPGERIRYDACISVDEAVNPEGEIGTQKLEGGLYAMTTHIGPYEKLSTVYAQVCGQWMPAQGYEIPSRPSIEVYQNSPEDTEPEDLITDIHVPLQSI